MQGSKVCNKCDTQKSLDEFYPATRCKDGREGRCKECAKAHVKAWQAANPAKVRASQERQRAKAEYKDRMRRYQEDNREREIERKRRYYTEHKDAILAKQAERYRENRERVREYGREYRERNRERRNAQKRQYYQANRDRLRAQSREWARNNPERVARRSANWQRENRERCNAANRKYARLHPERVKAAKAAYRRRYRSAQGYAPADAVLARVAYYGKRCYLCGGPYEALDHVKPIASGGTHWPANLRPACKECNSRKAGAWPLSAIEEVVGSPVSHSVSVGCLP